MIVNLYYTPYPCQQFAGIESPISPVRTNVPKSTFETLVAGADSFLRQDNIEVDFKIYNMQLEEGKEKYKSFYYGDRQVECYRVGASFEKYENIINNTMIHCVSNNFTNSASIVTDFVKYIKKVNPTAIVIAGGIDISARPQYYIRSGVDYIILSEGEWSFYMLLKSLITHKDVTSLLPTVRYGNGIIIQKAAPIDINLLPPMRLDLVSNLQKYTDTGEGQPPSNVRSPFLCWETSRGCDNKCSYCATPMRGAYRHMNANTVRKHATYYQQMGIRNLLFQEDNILSRLASRDPKLAEAGRREIIDIFTLLKEMGFSWEFANGLEFGKFLKDGSLDIELMESLLWNNPKFDWQGCYRVQISLEYLDPIDQKSLPKLRRLEEQIYILKTILDLGVYNITFNVIIGNPNDSIEKIDRYMKYCENIKDRLISYNSNANIYFNIYNKALLPGSADFLHQTDKLQFDIEQIPEVISLYFSAMNTKHMTYFELFKKRIEFTSKINGEKIELYDKIWHE